MLDKHTWPGGLHHFIAQQHGPLLYGPLEKESGEPIHPTVILSGSYGALVNAEILRLAQRERDLEAGQKAQAERLADLETALQRKSDDLAAARAVNDNLAAKVAKLEELQHVERERVVGIVRRYVSNAWEAAQVEGLILNPGETASEFAVDPLLRDGRLAALDLEKLLAQQEAEILEFRRRLAEKDEEIGKKVLRQVQLRKALEASESRGRQYCTELAEKAGEIRELRARIRAGDALRRDLGGENERLRAEAQKLARDGEDMRCLVNDIRAAAPTEPAPGRTTVETIALMESLLKDLRAANRQSGEKG